MKTAVVEVTIRLLYDLPDDYSDEDARYRISDSLCLDNLLDQIDREEQEANDQGFCYSCWRAEGRFVEWAADGKDERNNQLRSGK